jgi:hypothetical protein
MFARAGEATLDQRIELRKRPCIEKATPCALISLGKISELKTNAAASIPKVYLKDAPVSQRLESKWGGGLTLTPQ